MLLICLTGNKFSVQALPYGQTVTASVYVEFLKKTGERWRTLRRHPTKLSDLTLQHDNARPHVAKLTKDFLERRNVRVAHQSSHSPDFNILDRWVNAHLKTKFKRMIFSNHIEVEEAALQTLREIPEDRFLRKSRN